MQPRLMAARNVKFKQQGWGGIHTFSLRDWSYPWSSAPIYK